MSNAKFYIRFRPDSFNTGYYIACVMRKTDTSDDIIAHLNIDGFFGLDLTSFPECDFIYVMKIIHELMPIYKELLKIKENE